MPMLAANGTELYYEVTEADAGAPTILFAHGAGGNAAIWYNQTAYFAPRYRCITFDHRAFGRSPVGPLPLTVHKFRDDALALLDHLEVEQAHFVGQSMGGFTSIRCALDAPDRVASLTMSATPGGIYNPTPTEAARTLTSGNGAVRDTMAQATFAKPDLLALYAAISDFNVNFSWDKLATLLSAQDVIQHESLAQIACPVLFIAGREDPLFPPEQLASFVPHFKTAAIEIVEDAGHSPYFEQPQIFNQLLANFIG